MNADGVHFLLGLSALIAWCIGYFYYRSRVQIKAGLWFRLKAENLGEEAYADHHEYIRTMTDLDRSDIDGGNIKFWCYGYFDVDGDLGENTMWAQDPRLRYELVSPTEQVKLETAWKKKVEADRMEKIRDAKERRDTAYVAFVAGRKK